RVQHHAIADHALLSRMHDAGRNKVEYEFLVADFDGVAGIGPALETDHQVGLLREEVHDLGFTFIAPLGAYYYSIRHAIPCKTATAGQGAKGNKPRGPCKRNGAGAGPRGWKWAAILARSEEHTSELQSRENLVCRPLLEKK